MFENIIGQEETVRALRSELAGARFPQSVLFFGPTYSGKLSTALEAARVLTCLEGRGEWSCECSSCRMQKELSHPQTALLGARYADVEIAASAEALTNVEKHARARTVRLRLSFQGDSVVLGIQDDGRGFASQRSKARRGKWRGIGLTNMRERALSLGGACDVRSTPKGGTTVSVRIPCRPAG